MLETEARFIVSVTVPAGVGYAYLLQHIYFQLQSILFSFQVKKDTSLCLTCSVHYNILIFLYITRLRLNVKPYYVLFVFGQKQKLDSMGENIFINI